MKKMKRCESIMEQEKEKKRIRRSDLPVGITHQHTQSAELDLPVGIIQRIQSFLDGKEAAQTSILSKSWYEAWSTSPILVFNHKGQSWNYVLRTIDRYQKFNLKLQKLVLRIEFPIPYDPDVDYYKLSYRQLLANASKLGVTELDVVSRYGHFTPQVFSVKPLIKLSISNACFRDWLDEFYQLGNGGLELEDYELPKGRLDGIILCSSLVSLRLHKVDFVVPKVLEDILLLCPSIENLELSNMLSYGRRHWSKVKLICPRLKSLSLHDVSREVADAVMDNVVLRSSLVENLDFSGASTPWSVSKVRSFTSLSFRHCRICLPSRKLLCSRLLSLRFEFVSVTDALMQSILLSCPLVGNLHLERPKGLSGINVSEMYNLASLFILTEDRDNSPPFKVSFESSITRGGGLDDGPEFKRLRSLSLGFVGVDDDFFNKFSTRFPCVEDLTLCLNHGSEDIRISSRSIKYFSLHHVGKLHNAEFDLLNIRKFVLNVEDVLPSFCFRTGSSDWESQLKLTACPLSSPTPVVESSWFVKLRDILKEVSLSRISLCVKVDKHNIFWVKDLPSSSSPTPVVENLMLHHNDSSFPSKVYLCALFGCCLPAFITLNQYSRSSEEDSFTYNFAQILHELFVSQNTKCVNRIQNSLMYDLEEVDIEVYSELEWQTIPLAKFVEDAPVIPLNKEQVRFRFKWGAFKCT